MSELIPAFDFQRVFIVPWAQNFAGSAWITAMGFFVTTACGLVGNYLILRRMALVGDAISHSVLPGLAAGFLVIVALTPENSTKKEAIEFFTRWKPLAMFIGAMVAAMLTVFIIELIHKRSRVKPDAAIGITFTSLFALGVILISLFASKVDLDQECVLYGEIGYVQPDFQTVVSIGGVTLGPEPVVRMGLVTCLVALLIGVFYKELLVSSFDPALSFSLGINSTFVHYALMAMLSVVVVSAFEAVGAILVIAMLILPGATATLLSNRFPVMLGLTVLHAALSSVLGLHLGVWLDCSLAAAMVVAATGLFVLAWVFSPEQGLVSRCFKGRSSETAPLPESAGSTQ